MKVYDFASYRAKAPVKSMYEIIRAMRLAKLTDDRVRVKLKQMRKGA